MARSRSASGRMMLADLPPQLERHLLDGATRQLHDPSADLGATGEGDLVDVGVGGKLLADGPAGPGDEVDHALREQPGLIQRLDQLQRRKARVRGGLEDDRVAGDQRRRQLPAGHHQGEVPGDDLRADALGLAVDEVPCHRRHVDPWQRLVVLDLATLLRQRAEVLQRHRHMGQVGQPDRDPCVHRLDRGPVALNGDLGEVLERLEHDLAPGAEALGRPLALFEAPARRLDRRLGVFPSSLGDVGDDLAGGRVDAGEGLAAGRVPPLAVDVELVGLDFLGNCGGQGLILPKSARGPRRQDAMNALIWFAQSNAC